MSFPGHGNSQPPADKASRPPDQVGIAFWGALKPRGPPGAPWAGAPVAWISCFIDEVFASDSAYVYSSRFHHQAGNLSTSPLKPTGAVLSKAHDGCPPTFTRGGTLVSPISVFHLNSCLSLVTPQLLWHFFPENMASAPSSATSSQGDTQRGAAQLLESLGPADAPAQLADSLPPLPRAICLLLPRLQDPLSAPRDWVFHCGTAKFICCQALYIPHNSASQALLCMCLIFTIKKTNGESDSPDTLEGWAPALPWQNLGMNSISDLRLYFLHNTPVVFKSP